MPSFAPLAKEVFLFEQRKNNELNLEHIDEEMRMEQVRQLSSKLEWASFGQSVRRNLLDKRNTLDADSRIDVLKGIAYMRSNMPIEMASPIQERFRVMAESLGCSYKTTDDGWTLNKDELAMTFNVVDDEVNAVILGFWQDPSYFSQEATKLLQNGQWTDFRDRVAGMMAIYDKNITPEDLLVVKGGVRMLEKLFSKMATDNRFTSINRHNYGYYLPPGDLRPGRVYYIVEPLYRNTCAKEKKFQLDELDQQLLPYFEFSYEKHRAPVTYPAFNETDDWSDKVEANALICMKLSKGVMMSEVTRKKLGKISSRTASIRHYTNCYRHLTGEVQIKEDMKMITQFSEGVQHFYKVDVNSFKNEGDSVITEIYLKDLQDFHEVIAILRNEAMHMNLWESMMAMCYEKQGMAEHKVNAIKMDVFLSREEMVFSFETRYAPIKLYIRESSALEFKVQVVHAITGQQIADRIDETLSRKLNDTWSVPIMLTYAVSGEDCNLAEIKVPLRNDKPEKKVLPRIVRNTKQ